MIKRELKINFKNLIIWSLIPVLMLILVFSIYPSIISANSKIDINSMLNMFPKDLLKAFNMDISGINSVMGWFQSEGMIFILLMGGCYSSLLGGSILIKEESDKTIEYLLSKPISKNKIVTSKIVAATLNIFTFNLIIAITTFIGFIANNEMNYTKWALFSFSPLIIYYFFFFLSLFISTFFNKLKRTTGISLAIVFLSYTFKTLYLMTDKLEFLKYICPFELVNIRDIITNSSINIYLMFLGVTFCILLIFFTYIKYSKKELVI